MKLLRIHRGEHVSVFMDGATMQGVLTGTSFDGLTLSDARIFAEGAADWTDLEGSVFVPALSVSWVQVIGQ